MHEQLRQQYLQAMGIQLWESRAHDLPVEEVSSIDDVVHAHETEPTPVHSIDAKDSQVIPDWQTLQQQVATCQLCSLHESRISPVFGTGKQTADLMFIGEAPGAEEDIKGEPFVGRAGLLLNEMLMAIGFKREQVYIANILKCRPPNNRDPHVEEVEACEAYLHAQIQLLQPKLIVALGRIAAHNLLKTKASLASLRGRLHHCAEFTTPVVATYHPAYLLRTPLEKRKAWADLQWLLELLNNEEIA
jgi:DNA polymerase